MPATSSHMQGSLVIIVHGIHLHAWHVKPRLVDLLIIVFFFLFIFFYI